MKRGNVVLPRFGWDGPRVTAQRLKKSEGKSRHGGRSDAKNETENPGKLKRTAHGILGLGLLFKWGLIAKTRWGSGTLIEEGSFCAHGGELSGYAAGSKGKRFRRDSRERVQFSKNQAQPWNQEPELLPLLPGDNPSPTPPG